MAEKTIATSGGGKEMAGTGRERTRAQERFMLPPVDIYETADGLVLCADMPGVRSEDLQIRLEESILTIQGRAKHAVDLEPTYREFELGNFFRQFELSDLVDQDKITARLRHGVLIMELPRAEKAKPKQIPVRVEEKAAA
jgi:HSP20 family protein